MTTLAIWEPGEAPAARAQAGEAPAARAQAERWAGIIGTRRSIRTFDGAPLSRDDAAALSALVPERFGTARVRHVLIEGADAVNAIFRGLVGGYGKIIGAPALAAFIAYKDDADHQAALGFHGEQVILEAASRGLASCWVAGSFRRDVVRQYADLAEGEAVLCVTPIGRALAPTGLRRLHDDSMHWFLPNRGSRKPLGELVTGEVAAPWLREALEAARWAPSAVNRQPWRFTVTAGGQVTIGYEGAPEDARALDCGIAMANFAAAARAHGADGRWAPAEVVLTTR